MSFLSYLLVLKCEHVWLSEGARCPPLQQGVASPPIPKFTSGHLSAQEPFPVFRCAEKGAGQIFLSEATQRSNREISKREIVSKVWGLGESGQLPLAMRQNAVS